MKIQSQSLRHAPAGLQTSFDKAFIRILVARPVATNQQLAEWDIAQPLAKVWPSGPASAVQVFHLPRRQ